jgi:Insertion element 4 transposase N-terminal/Transposase DDE domain
VEEVIELTGCREKRQRLLPARVVVYFVLGLCLFSGADSMGPPGYRSVMRSLTNGLRHLHGLALPSSPALTKARQRLGSKPLELLFDLRRGALAAIGTPGAFAFGLRLVAWDGTGLDAADTPANAREFGVTQGGGPQLRLLALIECGTHAVIDAVFDGVARASEQRLARRLLHALQAGMLLLADRNFPGYELWGMVAATGADLLWRIKGNQVFMMVKALPDGSFLSVMPTPAENLRYGQARAAGHILPGLPQGHPVRIIEYAITITSADGTTRIESFRLVTTLLDHKRAPAAKLAALYHQRWENENGYAELKNRLRAAAFILRSRSPELVCQELFAFLTVYQALCALKLQTAAQAGIDPDQIFLYRDCPRRPGPRQQPGPPHPAGPRRGPPPGHPRSPRRPPAQEARPPVRTRQEAAQEHLPVQETRPSPATQQGHLPDQNKPEGTSTGANTLTHWHCSSGALFTFRRAAKPQTRMKRQG